MNDTIATLEQNLTEAANGFKQMQIVLMIFSAVVTVAIVMIAIGLNKQK